MEHETHLGTPAVFDGHDDPSDERLVALARDGDTRALESIMRRHNRMLFRTVRGILRTDSDVEDVLQEGYLKAFRNLHQFGPPLRLRAWLARIVVNEALMHRRRLNPAAPSDTPDNAFGEFAAASGPFDEAARSQLRRVLELAIDRLPAPFRCVLMLRDVEQLSIAETAQCLDLNEATVKTRLHRARLLMRHDLVSLMGIDGPSMFDFAGRRCELLVVRVLAALRGESVKG